MATKTILSQTGQVGAGSIINFSETDNIRTVQINPNVSAGFSGSLKIEGSFAASPGANDFVTLAEITFTAHTANMTIEVFSNAPNIRANIITSNQGEVAVFGSSRTGTQLNGGSGSGPATAIIRSSIRSAVVGTNVRVEAPVVPSITSDDVVYANDFNKTVTQELDNKQTKIGSGAISSLVLETDINLLGGMAAYGLSSSDLQKLADLTATTSELNYTVGGSSNFQAQIDGLSSNSVVGAGVDLTGLTVSAGQLNSFFSIPITASGAEINILDGLIASTADLNGLAGTAGSYSAADLSKLGSITASATEINTLGGWTGTSTDLNKLVGLVASTTDLNALVGLAGTGVTVTEIGYLSGLTQNVETTLNSFPNLTGLTASVSDLNLLAGAFAGTGAFPGAITSNELSYLDGLTGNIQSLLNQKRDISVSIGISEISGASITTTELNYLQGATANIQAQIDAINFGAISTTGGTFSGSIFIANGTAAAPGLGYAGSNNTGLYLYGANGIGLTISGSRVATLDGTDFVIGDGVTLGSPVMKGSGFNAANPSFSFVGDLDTGVYHGGANIVGIGANGAEMATFDGAASVVTVGGATASNNAIDFSGVFSGEKMLGKAAVLAGSVTGGLGQTPLYTVPVGRNAIITKVIVRLTNVTGFVDGSVFRMNVGFTGPVFDEIVDNVNNVGIFNPGGYSFDTAAQVMPLGVGDNTFPAISGSAGADYQVLSSTQTLQADVVALAGANDYDMEVIIMGYEFL